DSQGLHLREGTNYGLCCAHCYYSWWRQRAEDSSLGPLWNIPFARCFLEARRTARPVPETVRIVSRYCRGRGEALWETRIALSGQPLNTVANGLKCCFERSAADPRGGVGCSDRQLHLSR